jgi:hypothetical protein
MEVNIISLRKPGKPVNSNSLAVFHNNSYSERSPISGMGKGESSCARHTVVNMHVSFECPERRTHVESYARGIHSLLVIAAVDSRASEDPVWKQPAGRLSR